MNSPKSRAGKLGCAVMSTGESTTLPIGREVAHRVEADAGLAAGMRDVRAVERDQQGVAVGRAGGHGLVAMAPPAPVRFSTTTCLPSTSPRRGAMMRAVMSAMPPGARPTTSRMGLSG